MNSYDRLPFDSFEVRACYPSSLDTSYEAEEGETTFVTTYRELDWFKNHLFYTVYGHRKASGCIAIGDFAKKEDAINMAHALANTSKVEVWVLIPGKPKELS